MGSSTAFRISALLVFSLNSPTFAGEVDNFRFRDRTPIDATAALNEVTQELIDAAVEGINVVGSRSMGVRNRAQTQTQVTCDRTRLIDALRSALDTEPASDIERALYRPPLTAMSFLVDTNETIYRNVTSSTSFMLANNIACCNKLISVNGTQIGGDKISHFFTHGFTLYEVHARSRGSEATRMQAVWNAGLEYEEGNWGLRSTGIKSFGDLSANYDGMRFWQQVADGPNPYFRCVDGNWVKNRTFDWKDFVTDAWDEAINCSHFSSRALVREISSGLTDRQSNARLSCPVSPQSCANLVRHYGTAAENILSTECLGRRPQNERPGIGLNLVGQEQLQDLSFLNIIGEVKNSAWSTESQPPPESSTPRSQNRVQ